MMKSLIKKSDVMQVAVQVTQHRVVMREYLNDKGKLFGGNALKWMDEVAYITASKYTRQKMVTVFVDKIRFLEPITEGSMLQITGKVISAGNVKSVVKVELWIDGESSSAGIKAVEGLFTFVAVDDSGKPVRRISGDEN